MGDDRLWDFGRLLEEFSRLKGRTIHVTVVAGQRRDVVAAMSGIVGEIEMQPHVTDGQEYSSALVPLEGPIDYASPDARLGIYLHADQTAEAASFSDGWFSVETSGLTLQVQAF